MNRLICIVCGLSVLLSATAQFPPDIFKDICNWPADVVIAVPAENFQYSLEFEKYLIQLVSFFNIAKSEIQVGLVLYGRKARRVLSLKKPSNRKQINTHISVLARRQSFFDSIGTGKQNLVNAFRAMRYIFRRSYRFGKARKIGVIFTQGQISTSGRQGRANVATARLLQRDGVVMYNLGSSVKQSIPREFEFIGTDRCRLFSLRRLTTGLPSVVPFLASAICSELDPHQTVSLEGSCYPNYYAFSPPIPLTCESFGNFPDPNNCMYFYSCVQGHPRPYRTPCADDTFYSPSLKVCVNQNQYFCQ